MDVSHHIGAELTSACLSPSVLSDPERLSALTRSGLLNKDARGRLELLCETAHELLHVPMVLVNVLDDAKQITVGAYPKGESGRVLPIRDTGCQETVKIGEVVSIPNTLLHPVLCMIPAVRVAGVRSYLGVPIYHEGYIMGAFCCADYVVREWSFWEQQGLIALARLAGLSVERDE